MKTEKYTFEDLKEIVARLRGENGCPWDMEQTHQSIKESLIEEGYELIEAIDSGDNAKIADESGDVLLQVVFHAQIGAENNEYTMEDVTDCICRKLIHRHPHVFGDISVENSDEVLKNWDAIKRNDREQKSITDELKGVSDYLPSLMKAKKIQSKAEKAGYMFPDIKTTAFSLGSILMEMTEINDKEIAEKYIGKILFNMVVAARELGIDPEVALSSRIHEFINEFEKFENDK